MDLEVVLVQQGKWSLFIQVHCPDLCPVIGKSWKYQQTRNEMKRKINQQKKIILQNILNSRNNEEIRKTIQCIDTQPYIQ